MCPISQGSSDIGLEYGFVKALTPHAVTAANNAYAPYSGLRVGAALRVDNDDIYSGCNVENASYGLTQCAERNAIGQAVAQGVQRGEIRSMLIFVPGDRPFSPCGACRQVMHELMAEDAQVISCCEGGESLHWYLSELLPNPFDL
jgi:cytidine deaminase